MAPVSEPFAATLSPTTASVAELSQQASTCNVLCLGIDSYEARAVSEQLLLKEHLNAQLSLAIRHVAPNDRIVLDTHDGIAISFLGRPEDAFLTAVLLRDALARPHPAAIDTTVRIGLNCGPVRLVTDPKGSPSIVGDGINVARRIMHFANPRSALVSRSFFETVTHIAEAHRDIFAYFGARTDNNVRTHELYEITLSESNSAQLEKITGLTGTGNLDSDHASLSSNDEQFDESSAGKHRAWLHNTSAAYIALSLAAACLLVAVVVTIQKLTHHPLEGPRNSIQSAWRPDALPRDTVARLNHSEPAVVRPDAGTTVAQSASNESTQSSNSHLTSGKWPNSIPATAANRKDKTLDTFATIPRRVGDEPQPTPLTTVPAVVSLAVAPWGEVYVNGRKAGVSPPLDHIEVEPGMVHIEIRNSGAQSYSEVVQLAAGEQARVKHKFPNP